jgi:hypothetical protein
MKSFHRKFDPDIHTCCDYCFRYWPSIMQLHCVATYLDPSFRNLSFVTDKSYRSTQHKTIKEGLITMAIDVESVEDTNSVSVSYK